MELPESALIYPLKPQKNNGVFEFYYKIIEFRDFQYFKRDFFSIQGNWHAQLKKWSFATKTSFSSNGRQRKSSPKQGGFDAL